MLPHAPSTEDLRHLETNLVLIVLLRVVTIGAVWLPMPIIVLFATQNGITPAQFLVLQIAFQLTAFVFEIPLGFLADRYGQKRVITWGLFFLAAGAFTYSCAHDFRSFLFGEILYALGQAALFGAEQALLRRSLEKLGRSHDFQRKWGNALSLELVVAAATMSLGGLLFTWSSRLPFLCESAIYGLMFVLSWFLIEPGKQRSTFERKHPVREAAYVTRLCLLDSPCLRWIMMAGAFWSAILVMIGWSQADSLLEHGVAQMNLGIYFGLLSVIGSIVGLVTSRRGVVKLKRRASWVLLLLFTGGLLLCAAAPFGESGMCWSLLGLVMLQLPRSAWRVISAGWLKEELPTEFHATGISVSSAMNRLGYVLLAACVLPFFNGWSLQAKLMAFAIISLIGGVTLFVFAPKQVSQNAQHPKP